MWGFSGKLTGSRVALARLSRFKPSVQRRIQRPALAVAAKPMLDKARAIVPVETGLLKRSLFRKIKTYGAIVVVILGPRTGMKKEVMIRKGPRRGKKEIRNPTRYAHLVHDKVIAFLEIAYRSNVATSQRIMRQKLWEGIRKEAKKR